MTIKYIYDQNEGIKLSSDDNFIDTAFTDRLNNITESLKIIDFEIAQRHGLSIKVMEEIAEEKKSLDDYLHQAKWCFPGYNSGIDSKRNLILKNVFALDKEERAERIRCQKDVTMLRQKQLEKFEEYRGLASLFKSMALKNERG